MTDFVPRPPWAWPRRAKAAHRAASPRPFAGQAYIAALEAAGAERLRKVLLPDAPQQAPARDALCPYP